VKRTWPFRFCTQNCAVQGDKAEKVEGEAAETEEKKQHSLLEEKRRKRDSGMRKTRAVR
jgi:hypothetical protein